MDTQTLYLPKEMIEEILSNLPVKPLLRFRCVSKSWCCLIGSNQFIKTHLQKSKPSHERWQSIFMSDSKNPNHRLNRCPRDDLIPIDDPINHHLIPGSKFVGHINGLVCIRNLPALFFLWNPTTRISIQLTKPDCELECIVKSGFGWDPQSDAYKVFAVLSKKKTRMSKIYSSKTNSWKTVEQHGSLDLVDVDGEFSCGRICWLERNGWIETFDLRSEVFGRIELHWKQMAGDHLWLKSWIQYDLCVVYYDSDKKMKKVWLLLPLHGEKQAWFELDTRGACIPYSNSKTCYCVESLVPPVSQKSA
ncbi:F-box/kelch-repeat protein At3g23880-like [Salvia splendens]|uniref:F-box/kelch-repeat protein At3g23880-like n=1 Tax=Salvia splendens TaxID=180675 RepID=UPI001C25EC03|nr:F-box/kelch-repeat protein At3g23880-like [Salvia splendens]